MDTPRTGKVKLKRLSLQDGYLDYLSPPREQPSNPMFGKVPSEKKHPRKQQKAAVTVANSCGWLQTWLRINEAHSD